MDGFVAPDRWPEPVKALGIDAPLAIVLPTTHTLNALHETLGVTVIGKGVPKEQAPAAVLRRLAEGERPKVIVVHTDQLHLERDATVLVHFADQSVFMSPVEYILCQTYGYRLLVWGPQGFHDAGPDATLASIAHVLRAHLQHCALLGEDWLEAAAQGKRQLDKRVLQARRHMRYMGSSIARAYRNEPGRAAHLLEMVAGIDTLATSSRP